MLKKQSYSEGEIPIFDEAIIYKRGKYWQFRMWLSKEGKYARKSLQTRSQATAFEKGKEYYLEILGNQKAGKTYFSLTTKEGVEKYIAHRQKDVEIGSIVPGRLVTIKTHLQHFLNFIKKDTKLKELEHTDCEDYYYHRTKITKGIKQVTVLNEQSTINSMMKYLFRNNETYIEAFYFQKLKPLSRNIEGVRRATFSNKEYEKLYTVMRDYCSNKSKKVDDGEVLIRNIIRYYILIAANSGLRVGEQRQLKWGDIRVEKVKSNGENKVLARIRVREETSKVKRGREFYCRGGNFFERLREVVKCTDDDALVFSVDGKTMLSKRTLLYHFHKLVDLAGIKDGKERGLVPYSLRHFMITQRVMSGLNFTQIADMCGTSVSQIENTYYHLNDEIRLSNALADYKRNVDGTIEPI